VSSLTTAYGAAQQTQITNRENSLEAQVSAYGTFTSSLDSLQATLSALETPSALAGFDATVADKTIATATASSDAVAGQYSLAVQNLATSATLDSAPVSSSAAIIGTGTLNIAVGGASTSIVIDSSDDTLAGIASAINAASNNPGVSASILTTTSGSRLVLSGTATGAANAITVTETDGGNGLSSLVYDPANNVTHLTQTTAAADANFTLNGYAATSASNVVTGAISGVTLNLQGVSAVDTTTGTSTPTILTISPDTTAASTAITAFVTALSATLTSVQTLTGYNASTQTAGALQGDPTLQGFQNQLENILDTITSGSGGSSGIPINTLADIGVTANPDGSYSTDATTLSTALEANLSGVANLLGGTNGIATQIDALVTQYTQAGGILSNVNQGLQTGLTNVSNAQTALNAQLATYSATLTAQYNAMDTAVAALKQTQQYLTAEFNPNSSSSSYSTSSLSSGTTST